MKDVLRKSFGFALPLGALYVVACGGSATFHDGGSAGSAGSAPSAGSGGWGQCTGACPLIACAYGSTTQGDDCCPTCLPGGTAGTVGAGGSASGAGGTGFAGATGGVGGCTGNYACPAIACGPGSTTVMDPVTCCATCVTDNDGGAGACASGCVSIACAPGYSFQKMPGDCCPTCQPDAQACTLGQQGYQSLRASLLAQPGATSCVSDSDCTILDGAAKCGDVCVTTTVNAALATDMDSQLSLWATDYCSTCTVSIPPCPAPPKPFCSGGECQLYHVL